MMIKKVIRKQIFRGFSSLNNNKSVLFDTEIIKQDLINYFNTRQGERVMMADYGTIIWDSLYEPFTEVLRDELIADVRRGFALEPRVNLLNLIVDQFEHGIVFQADIEYVSFNTSESFNLSFDKRSKLVGVI
jgi:phage baseplate assembly protein W